MDDLATLDAFDRTQQHLQTLTAVRPGRLVADRHPAYRSVTWARTHAETRPVRYVQHHHAHIASVLGEHGHDGREQVIGIAFDGTGYGTDGAVWGGEVLLADYAGFRRYAHLRYVPLPGGDAAVLRPYRMALSHLAAAGVDWPGEMTADLPPVRACPPKEKRVLRHQLASGLGCVPTSSMGRLFDAVSSIAGVRHVVDFEAQAAIELEGLSRAAGSVADPYAFKLLRDAPDGPLLADASPVVRAAAADVLRGTDPGVVGARFHGAVRDLVLELARRARRDTGLETVALGGGVFQNALLLGGVCRALRRDGFTVLRPHSLPPNDGGLALGQVLVAATQVTDGSD